MKFSFPYLVRIAVVSAFWLIMTMPAAAHCDTMKGPVVAAAQQALASGDVTPLLKWVKSEHEAEVRDAFTRAQKVRTQNPDSRELADRYFLETVVRLHRSGEGEPFTGLKDEEPDEAIATADRALETGRSDALIEAATRKVAADIRQRFERVRQARKRADESVSAGREYVEAYVAFVHYVEKLHEGETTEAKHASLREQHE